MNVSWICANLSLRISKLHQKLDFENLNMTTIKLDTFECDVRGHFKHQTECEKCVVGDLVWLIPEPDNEYDAFAIRILNSNGRDLGYIPSEDNEEILEILSTGEAEYCAKVSSIEKDDSEQTLPWITVFISNDKNQLPFQQENKFSLHTQIGSGATKHAFKKSNNQNEEEQEDDSKNLMLGILFVVGLIVIAKLISLI